MITFKQNTELEVVESFDEDTDTSDTVNEMFVAGEPVDGDILDDDGKSEYVDIEFGDGGVAFHVRRDSFTVL